jgi:hypothetical protein
MSTKKIDQLLALLKDARENLAASTQGMTTIIEEAKARPEYLVLSQAKETTVFEIVAIEEEVRQLGAAMYAADSSSKQIHEKLSVAIKKNIVVKNMVRLRAWVEKKLPAALVMDQSVVDGYIRGTKFKDIPNGIAIEEEVQVRIAKEL